MTGPDDFNYVGGELGLFAHATNWKNYWSRKLAPFLTGDVLEVGAGLGTNTLLLRPRASGQWTCLEPDRSLIATLHAALAAQQLAASCRVLTGTVDDLPPATLVTSIESEGAKRIVRGVSHDNGEVRLVTVNGLPARITAQHAGVADWVITLELSADGQLIAQSSDSKGNIELTPHSIRADAR